jgi:hypothetical protein
MVIIIVIMSGFHLETISNESNESMQITPELELLLNIRSYLEMQIGVLNEQIAFRESLDGSLSPFIESFSNEFKEHFPRVGVDQDLLVLDKLMSDVVQQIKGVCKHQYEEDNIDITDGCCEQSQKITYCLICYSTF